MLNTFTLANLQLSALELFNILQNKNLKVFIIDVRTEAEFNYYHLENAVNISISKVDLNTVLSILNIDHNTKAIILTYCNAGGRGGRAFNLLNSQLSDYINQGNKSLLQIANLKNGINEYISANLSGIWYNK